MKNKHILDEMQENKLLKIEGAGFWLAFGGLLMAIIIQVVLRPDIRLIAGELVVFFAICIYLVVLCLKNGLWSRNPAPTVKSSVIFSAAAALIVGAVLVVRSQLILHSGFSKGLAAFLLLFMAAAFGGCFATLEITRAIYRRRRSKLDQPGEENEER